MGPQRWELCGGSENQEGQREAQGGEKMTGTRHGQVPKTGSVPDVTCPLSGGGQRFLKTRYPGSKSGTDGARAVFEEDWQERGFEYKRRRILVNITEGLSRGQEVLSRAGLGSVGSVCDPKG